MIHYEYLFMQVLSSSAKPYHLEKGFAKNCPDKNELVRRELICHSLG